MNQRFHLGDRVRVTKEAVDHGVFNVDALTAKPVFGTVAVRPSHPNYVSVKIAGRKHGSYYWHSFWEVVPSASARRERDT